MASTKCNNNDQFSWQNLEITAPKREVWVDDSLKPDLNPEKVVRLGPWNSKSVKREKPKLEITSPKKGILRLASKYDIRYLKVEDLPLKKTILNDEIVAKEDKVDLLKTRLAKRREARKKEKGTDKNAENEFVVVDNLEDAGKAKRRCSEENLPEAKKTKILNNSEEKKHEINEDKSDPEIVYSAADLCKFEFNVQFALRRCSTDKFSRDFCVLTAASCIRNSRQFREYLKQRKTQVKAKGREITENGNAALVLAESTFLKICERIEQSKDETMLGSQEFIALVNSLQSSSAAEEFYKAREEVFIDTVRPELKEKLKKDII